MTIKNPSRRDSGICQVWFRRTSGSGSLNGTAVLQGRLASRMPWTTVHDFGTLAASDANGVTASVAVALFPLMRLNVTGVPANTAWDGVLMD